MRNEDINFLSTTAQTILSSVVSQIILVEMDLLRNVNLDKLRNAAEDAVSSVFCASAALFGAESLIPLTMFVFDASNTALLFHLACIACSPRSSLSRHSFVVCRGGVTAAWSGAALLERHLRLANPFLAPNFTTSLSFFR